MFCTLDFKVLSRILRALMLILPPEHLQTISDSFAMCLPVVFSVITLQLPTCNQPSFILNAWEVYLFIPLF